MLFHFTQYAVPVYAAALPEAGRPFLCLTTKGWRNMYIFNKVFFFHLEMAGSQCNFTSTTSNLHHRGRLSAHRILEISLLSVTTFKTKEKKEKSLQADTLPIRTSYLLTNGFPQKFTHILNTPENKKSQNYGVEMVWFPHERQLHWIRIVTSSMTVRMKGRTGSGRHRTRTNGMCRKGELNKHTKLSN